MNGFGGDVEPKFIEIAKRTTELLAQIGASSPITFESTLADLRCASDVVLSSVNEKFFPTGAGLVEGEVTGETTMHERLLEISHNLSLVRDRPGQDAI